MKFCECEREGVQGAPASMYDPVKELPFVIHAPGQCKCQNELKLYSRDGKKLLLCSICHIPGDIKEASQ